MNGTALDLDVDPIDRHKALELTGQIARLQYVIVAHA
jgi:hypothetical protein